MPITVRCPGCNTRYNNVSDTAAGKQTTCPKCRTSIHVPPLLWVEPLNDEQESPLPVARVLAVEVLPEVPPSRRSRPDRNEDEERSYRQPPPRQEHSPFVWGFWIAIGFVVGLFCVFVLVCGGLSFLAELNRSSREPPQQQQRR